MLYSSSRVRLSTSNARYLEQLNRKLQQCDNLDEIELDFRHFLEIVDARDCYSAFLSGQWTINEILELEPSLIPKWKRFHQETS